MDLRSEFYLKLTKLYQDRKNYTDKYVIFTEEIKKMKKKIEDMNSSNETIELEESLKKSIDEHEKAVKNYFHYCTTKDPDNLWRILAETREKHIEVSIKLNCLKFGYTVEEAREILKRYLSVLPTTVYTNLGKMKHQSGYLKIMSRNLSDESLYMDYRLFGVRNGLLQMEYLGELITVAQLLNYKVFCNPFLILRVYRRDTDGSLIKKAILFDQ